MLTRSFRVNFKLYYSFPYLIPLGFFCPVYDSFELISYVITFVDVTEEKDIFHNKTGSPAQEKDTDKEEHGYSHLSFSPVNAHKQLRHISHQADATTGTFFEILTNASSDQVKYSLV